MAAEVAAAIDAQIFKSSTTGKNRNIPEAIFIENVEGMCKDRSSADVVGRLQELYSKYQYMQSSLLAQRASLKAKLPDITAALETVQHLIDRRDKDESERDYTYQLCENIYAKASVPPTNNVCLWLGANCMLEYTLEEAVELLTKNQENAKTTLKTLEEDMAFLRDQLTTTEVNIARTHNFGVKLRQQQSSEKDVAAEGSAQPRAPAFKPEARTIGVSGGDGPGHSWKQTAEEVEVHVPLPTGAQKSDIKVTFLTESLRVELKGEVLLEGELSGKCVPGGSAWTINEQRIEITLEKATASPWQALFDAEGA